MLKQIIAKATSILLQDFSIEKLCKILNIKVIVPCYHVVSNTGLPHIKHLYPYRNVQQFEQDLAFYTRHFNWIDLPQLIASVKNGEKLPERACLLTFDDGFREMSEIVAPVLKQHNIPAVFFLNTAFLDNRDMFFRNKASVLTEMYRNGQFSEQQTNTVKAYFESENQEFEHFAQAIMSVKYPGNRHLIEKTAGLLNVNFPDYLQEHRPYMSRNQVQQLVEQGFHIGAHSINHLHYAELPYNEQVRQTLQSTRELVTDFNLDYAAFAFPYNDNNVSKAFFQEIFNEIDISFGTEGCIDDSVKQNIQRPWIETSNAGVEKIIRYYINQKLLRQLKGKKVINRL